MSKDIDRGARMRLGPIVRDLLNTLPEPTPAALDAEVQRLLDFNKASLRARNEVSIPNGFIEKMESVENATLKTGELVAALTDLVNHRTRELAKLCLHISGLVGNSLTEEGEERDHLHRRFNDIFTDLGKQMGALSELVLKQKGEQSKALDKLAGRAEEERLTVPEKSAERDKEMER